MKAKLKMPNTWFQFKQFKIEQGHTAMKVGTDGVLLGAWATVPGPGSRVLDVGCGTGLIALMIAQRTKDVKVDAMEIDPSSAGQAQENFRNSPWKERVHCKQASYQDFAAQCKHRYDLIICNPPFFSASLKTRSIAKNFARHDDSLSLEALFRVSVSLMKETSMISLVLPVQKEAQIMDLLTGHKLFCNRLTRVKPTPGKPAKRILLELSFNPGTAPEDELTIETDKRHVYTDKFQALVDEFYL